MQVLTSYANNYAFYEVKEIEVNTMEKDGRATVTVTIYGDNHYIFSTDTIDFDKFDGWERELETQMNVAHRDGKLDIESLREKLHRGKQDFGDDDIPL